MKGIGIDNAAPAGLCGGMGVFAVSCAALAYGYAHPTPAALSGEFSLTQHFYRDITAGNSRQGGDWLGGGIYLNPSPAWDGIISGLCTGNFTDRQV